MEGLNGTGTYSRNHISSSRSLRSPNTMLFSATTALLGLAATVLSAPVFQKRAVIAHDAVVGFAETVPSGVTGTLYLKYKPYLKNDSGCVPFPAVDAAGNTGCVRAPLLDLFQNKHQRKANSRSMLRSAVASLPQAPPQGVAPPTPAKSTLERGATTERTRSCMRGIGPRTLPRMVWDIVTIGKVLSCGSRRLRQLRRCRVLRRVRMGILIRRRRRI